MLAGYLLGAAALVLHGCAAKVPATVTVPGRAGTPMENVLAYNASIAEANRAVADAVIAAQKAGEISVAAANNLLTAQSMIADADRQLTIVFQEFAVELQTNPGAKLSAATVNALLGKIKNAATRLVSSGDIGIKNAKRQQGVLSSVNGILGFVQQIDGALGASGLLGPIPAMAAQ